MKFNTYGSIDDVIEDGIMTATHNATSYATDSPIWNNTRNITIIDSIDDVVDNATWFAIEQELENV